MVLSTELDESLLAEGLARELVHAIQTQRKEMACQYTDLCYFISPRTVHTGTAILQLSGYGPGFINEHFSTGGSVFNMDITYEPDTTVNGAPDGIKQPVPLQGHLGTDFTDLGDQEQYRSPFDIRSATAEMTTAGSCGWGAPWPCRKPGSTRASLRRWM